MSKTILVTGSNGFVGHHVVQELCNQGNHVIGVGQEEVASYQNNKFLVGYIQCDLTSPTNVAEQINYEKVDGVIHLAGLANVGQSFSEPAHFLAANASMCINLLQQALDTHASTRFIVVSSGAVYESKQPLPIAETGTLSHGSPYSVSKLSVEMMGDYYRSRGMTVVITRPFNHFGPGQGPGFIVPDLLSRLIDFRDNHMPLTVGDLSTARDYTDVRDVARAYTMLATSENTPAKTVYNVCSGKSRTGKQILDQLLASLNLPTTPDIQVDQLLLRPNDAKDIYGDNTRISQEFGWQPEISFETTIADVASDQRSR